MASTRFLPPRLRHSPARVLVAEDDPELRRLVSAVLEYDGYEVIEAVDGTAMFEQLSRRREKGSMPDVIVSDVFMPGLSGLDVLGKMRELGMRAPVVLMTAFSDSCSEERARELGAVTLVEKPFELDDLRMIVLNLVPRREAPMSEAHP